MLNSRMFRSPAYQEARRWITQGGSYDDAPDVVRAAVVYLALNQEGLFEEE